MKVPSLPRAGRWVGPALRLLSLGALLALCGWGLQDELARLDAESIAKALAALESAQWLAGLLSVLLAFFAVSGQERAAMGHLGLSVDRRRGRDAAMATAAIAQTVGFGPLVGTVVRKRLLPGLSLKQSAQVSFVITAGFFAGIALLWLAVQAVVALGPAAPALFLPPIALAALVADRLPASLRRRFPDAWTMLRFGLWLTLDLLSLALAAWILLPSGLSTQIGFAEFLPVFLTALAAGLASGSPAGTGPFEAILLDGMPQAAANEVAAGIIAFRLAAYAVPAACGALFAIFAPLRRPFALPGVASPDQPGADSTPLTQLLPAPAWMRRLPRAEVQLALQGQLALARTAGGLVWLHGRVPASQVFLGDPLPLGQGIATDRPALSAALASALDEAARHGRIPCLYRIGPRLAAIARDAGLRTRLIAREAVLDPATFTTGGPAKAGLRRKLRHAEAAGITVARPDSLPLPEMATVAALWARHHGGERGFSMGRFDMSHTAQQTVVLARSADGQLVAFLSFHVCEGEWVLDLIRSRPDMPDGTLYLAVTRSIAIARDAGARRFSLAAIPEPGWGVTGPLARVSHRLTARARGLEQFKQAFRPHWEPRYIAAPGALRLLFTAAGLAHAIHRPPGRPVSAYRRDPAEDMATADSTMAPISNSRT